MMEVHAFDETVGDGVDVPDLAIEKNVTAEALYELVNLDMRLALFAADHFDRFYVWIEFLPLTGPVGANLFFADYATSFGGLGPADVFSHEREGGVDVPMVEGGVGLGYQSLGVRHGSPGLGCGGEKRIPRGKDRKNGKGKGDEGEVVRGRRSVWGGVVGGW